MPTSDDSFENDDSWGDDSWDAAENEQAARAARAAVTGKIVRVQVDKIIIPKGREIRDPLGLKLLTRSQDKIGQLQPIFLQRVGRDRILVAGRHRLAAAKENGDRLINAIYLSSDDPVLASVVRASENFRTRMAWLDQAEEIEAVRQAILQEPRGDSKPPRKSQPHDVGVKRTARKLGIAIRRVRQARDTVALPGETKQYVREKGLQRAKGLLLRLARQNAGHIELCDKHLAAKEARRKEGAAEPKETRKKPRQKPGKPKGKNADKPGTGNPESEADTKGAALEEPGKAANSAAKTGDKSDDGNSAGSNEAAMGIPAQFIRLSGEDDQQLARAKAVLAFLSTLALQKLVAEMHSGGKKTEQVIATVQSWRPDTEHAG